MKLTTALREDSRLGKAPVLPIFPYPVANTAHAFALTLALFRQSPLNRMGLVFPGRQVLPGVPACRPRQGAFSEWDLFSFIYAVKQQTGAAIALAIHYRDILDFGIIPYAQEGHRVGLDLILVRDPILEELDYFSAEIVGGGISLGFVVPEDCPTASAVAIRPHLTGPVCLSGGWGNPGPQYLIERSPAPILFSRPGRRNAPKAETAEWRLPAALRGKGGWLWNCSFPKSLTKVSAQKWLDRLQQGMGVLRDSGYSD